MKKRREKKISSWPQKSTCNAAGSEANEAGSWEAGVRALRPEMPEIVIILVIIVTQNAIKPFTSSRYTKLTADVILLE